jgi:branched-chain amino acid transport system ATP-binding protein
MSEPFLIGDAMTGGYGKGPDILHDCTIAAEKGEIAVIVGPNGAGKSTAMKAVFGMLNVNSGSVRLDGEDQGDGLCAADVEHFHVDEC